MFQTFIWIIHWAFDRGSSAPSHFAEDRKLLYVTCDNNWQHLHHAKLTVLEDRSAALNQASRAAQQVRRLARGDLWSSATQHFETQNTSRDIFHGLSRYLTIFDLLRSLELFEPICKTKKTTDSHWHPTGALWGPCLATCKAPHVAGVYRPSLDCRRWDFWKLRPSWMKYSITRHSAMCSFQT